MRVLNFDYEFDRAMFRGNQEEIRKIYSDSSKDCTAPPVSVSESIWEVEVTHGDFPQMIQTHPLLKVTGFVLNWGNRSVNVFYSESGSDRIDQVQSVGYFDGHAEVEFRWYSSCPVTVHAQSCKEFYSNVGEYDRFTYRFPFRASWENGNYSQRLLTDLERTFQLSPEGTLIKCTSTDPVVRVPEGVTAIGPKAFLVQPYGQNSTMTEVVLPSSLRVIGKNGFQNCINLTKVALPEGLETIEDGAFSFSGVKELTLPMSLRELPGSCFSYSEIQQIHVPGNHPVFRMENGALYHTETHTLIHCLKNEAHFTVPEGVESLDAEAFANLSQLETITLPASLRRIGDRAFFSCRSLRSVVIPQGVTELGRNCFEYCYGLESLTLPERMDSIGSSAFSYCRKLDHLAIPEGVRALEYSTFINCDALTHITFPSTLEALNGLELSGLERTPWFTKRLNEPVLMAGGVLLRYKNGDKTAVIPQGTKRIVGSALSGSKDLCRVEFPDGLITICGNSFSGCTALEEAVLPDSVTRIFPGAFADCPSLEYLYAANAEPPCTPMGSGKCVSDTMVAVLPKLRLADQKPAAWKLALARGYLLHPELVPEEIRQENLEVVLKLRKKLLSWVFATDNVSALKLFLENTKTTKAKLKSEYLTPAEEAGAKECLAYLAGVTI